MNTSISATRLRAAENYIRAIAALLACLMLSFPNPALADPGEGGSLSIDPSKPVVVSMGDSYSSGEGCPPFYGSRLAKKGTGELRDWAAHRSQASWPGRLDFGSGPLSGQKDSNWLFVASSGAESRHIYRDRQAKRYYPKSAWQDLARTPYETEKLPRQDYILDLLRDRGVGVDAVTITIGGNDIGFTKTVQSMALHHLDPAGPWAALRAGWEKYNSSAKGSIAKAYREIRKKAGEGAVIIVAGYPPLLAERTTALWEEPWAVLVNDNVVRFDDELRSLVERMDEREGGNGRIVFVDVSEYFGGAAHAAYSDHPWINKIMLKRSEDLGPGLPSSAYSIHPNWCGKRSCGDKKPDCGVSAYAIAVQKEINKLRKAGYSFGATGTEKKPRKSTSLDLSDPETYQALNRYLSEFGMAAGLGRCSYYDEESSEWISFPTWEHASLPEEFLLEFATEYCSLFESKHVESAAGNDWGVGPGGSANKTCNMRVSTKRLNKVLLKYFDTTLDFSSIDSRRGRTVGKYYYWGITAPPTQGKASLVVAKSSNSLGDGLYRVDFGAIKLPDHYELFNDGSDYYSMTPEQAYSVDRGAIATSGYAIISYKPESQEPFEILGWDMAW